MPPTLSRLERSRSFGRPQSANTVDSLCKSDVRPRPGAPTTAGDPRSPSGPTPPRSITLPRKGSHLLAGLPTAGESVVALVPRKVRPPTAARHAAGLTIRTARRRPLGQVELQGTTLRSHPFASKRFHVLLNSLFKVLFNFPSRYLSAIGLVPVFSLRWSLPPTLGCIPKQPDSKDACSNNRGSRRGLTPALGEAPIRRTRTSSGSSSRRPKHHSSRHPKGGGFGDGLFPLHSPLLGESKLVSFPPLSNMLKFSG